MTTVELGILIMPFPGRAVPAALAAEQDGYDIALFPDSQNLFGETFTQLALVAAATDTIKIGTGVTNPITRHPATTAASILSVQHASGGRAFLGVGRGDSALGHIGMDYPAPMSVFEPYLRQVKAYLAGEEVDQNGFPSRIRWLDQYDLPKVPIDMSCSGPKTIAMAATLTDRVSLALGANPERIRWGIETARAAAEAAGRDPDSISIGAWVNTTVDDDRAAAREALRGGVASFTHFQGMRGNPLDEQPEILRLHSARLRTDYDTNLHAQANAPHAQALDDEFIDWFSICGPASEVAERLRELVDLGLDHIYLIGAMRPASRAAFAADVMPILRS
ncbi:MAG: LLM class flavin-dependent oxidoreductase [Chloroflexi bacterium]|nr:LLM class flavin-dependent oxidoreductase [Chloroflexota bacterium]